MQKNIEMLYSLKPFQCPFCTHSFTSRDSSRVYSISRYPLLLNCGHSICENCAKIINSKERKINCVKCKSTTILEDGDISVSKLLPDIYVLGILNANVKQGLPSLKMKMVPAVSAEKRQTKESNLILCELCSQNQASWRCDKCKENFCNICFDHVHKSSIKAQRNHHGTPIYAEEYNSLVQLGCSEHSNRSIEFFCEEDNEVVCSYCVVMGKHKGHLVLGLPEKNKACEDELKSAYEESVAIKRRLLFTENKLAQVIPSEKTDSSNYVKEIHDHFHRLHALLTMREHKLLSEVDAVSNSTLTPLERMRQNLSDTRKELEAIIKDAERTLENPYLAISAPLVIKKLKEAKEIPCHLVYVSQNKDEALEKGIELQFEPGLEELIAEYGKIEAHITTKYVLKPESSLPEDFVIEPLPVEPLTPDSESLTSRSDTFSEDSLNPASNVSCPLPLKYQQFTTSKQEKVAVSHIQHPNRFWVQRCYDLRKLKMMSEKINSWCRSHEASKHVPTVPKKGDLYLVHYSVDKKWYRGRVKEILPVKASEMLNAEASKDFGSLPTVQPMVEVFYVDFGNTEIVPVFKLRNIQSQFLHLPGIAKECSLWDIAPKNQESWSAEAIAAFVSFVGNKEVVMQVIEERNNVLFVDLAQAAAVDIVNDVPVSVRDALVFLEYGSFPCGGKKTSKKSKNSRKFMPPEQLRASIRTNIILCHIESPSLFYVQQLTTARYLSELIVEMQKVYNEEISGNHHNIYVPQIGMICAAQYSVDKMWYRAEIISLPGSAKVEVQYVDFGNKEIVHHRYLKKIFDRFCRLSKQAIACTLADITYEKGTGWSEETKDWLTKYASKRKFVLLSLGSLPGENKARTVLYDTDGANEICVNALMVEQGLALSTGSYSVVVKKPIPAPKETTPPESSPVASTSSTSTSSSSVAPKSVASEAKSPAIQEPSKKPEVLPEAYIEKTVKPDPEIESNCIEVYVSHIEYPSLFYIRLAGAQDEKLEMLMKQLQETYNSCNSAPPNVNEIKFYAALYEKDKKWYRSALVGKVNDEVVKVRYVDYGYVDTVPVQNLRLLSEDFCKEEVYAIKCHLADVSPAGDSDKWPQVACEAFKDLVAPYKTLYLTQKGPVQSNSLPADLLIKELIRGGALEPSTINYRSVVGLLIEKGVALRIRREFKIEKSSESKKEIPEENKAVKKTEETNANDEEKTSTSAVTDLNISNSSGERTGSPCSERASTPTSECSGITCISNSAKLSSNPATPRKKAKAPKVPPKPTFQWKPFELPSKTCFKGMPSYVGVDGCIYLQSLDVKGVVTMIKGALECKFSKIKADKLRIPPVVGEACIARFCLDNKWYRAEVISSTMDTVGVKFVDYGNEEDVPLEDIRTDIILKDIAVQCLECELDDVKPRRGKWDTDVLTFLHNSIVEHECTIEIKAPAEPGKRLKISLILDHSGLDIAKILKDTGFCLSLDEPDDEASDESPSADELSEQPKLLLSTCFKPATALKEGEVFPACITMLTEINIVYLQHLKIDNPLSELDEARNAELDRFLLLVEELNKTADSFPPVTDPKPGLACCARYTYDNNWYRCEISKIDSEGVHVLYVDYGNAEVLPVERLRRLDESLLQLPMQAHLCKLHGIESVDDMPSQEALSALINLYTGPVFARVVTHGYLPEVDLLRMLPDGQFELIYKDIVDQGLLRLSKA